MPDRYGDRPDDEPATVFACTPSYVADHQAAIDACTQCDDNGDRDGFPCDHIDWANVYRCGRSRLNDTMGWHPPKERP